MGLLYFAAYLLYYKFMANPRPRTPALALTLALQGLSHTVTASITYSYSPDYLWLQGGYGGIEEIKALEQARTDAADGVLDGVVDKKVLKEKGKEARGQGIVGQVSKLVSVSQ